MFDDLQMDEELSDQGIETEPAPAPTPLLGVSIYYLAS